MIIYYLKAYFLALFTSLFYVYSFTTALTKHPLLTATHTVARIMLAVLTFYYMLNLPPIHATLVVTLFGTIFYLCAKQKW